MKRGRLRGLRLTWLAATLLLAAALATACQNGGDAGDDGAGYSSEQVVAIVQGWPLLHQNDYECGTAVVPERTVISVVARQEYLDFEVGCAPDENGSAARRAVRLAQTGGAWFAEEEGAGRWRVTLDAETGRIYEWLFIEDGPQLVASGGDALLWPLFNFSGPTSR